MCLCVFIVPAYGSDDFQIIQNTSNALNDCLNQSVFQDLDQEEFDIKNTIEVWCDLDLSNEYVLRNNELDLVDKLNTNAYFITESYDYYDISEMNVIAKRIRVKISITGIEFEYESS